jgi:hypothetical protein
VTLQNSTAALLSLTNALQRIILYCSDLMKEAESAKPYRLVTLQELIEFREQRRSSVPFWADIQAVSPEQMRELQKGPFDLIFDLRLSLSLSLCAFYFRFPSFCRAFSHFHCDSTLTASPSHLSLTAPQPFTFIR